MTDNLLAILIVEDDPTHQKLLMYHLRTAFPDIELTIVATLAEAREAIVSSCPDIAFVDLNLPDGRGVDLLAEGGCLDSFPVIILTSQGGEDIAVEAIKKGATDYVVKSESAYADIQHCIERALRDWYNVSARKIVESDLRNNEVKYRRLSQEFQAILEGISASIALIDSQFRLVWANRAAIDRSFPGKVWQEGIPCFDFWWGNDEPCSGCPVHEAFQTGLPAEEVKEYDNGRTLAMRAFPMLAQEGSVSNVILLSNDITEKVQLRAETMHSSQLAALGELAAGVAHEINNPLNGVINYAQMLHDSNLHEEERALAQSIISESSRIAEIVSNLLTFSRKPQDEPQLLSLAEAMDGVLKLTAVKLRQDNIIIEIDIDADLPLLVGHYQTIQQVFLNIISNASYALNQKFPGTDPNKRLLITMSRFESKGLRWLRTTITDQGTGIAADILAKVCDPFFTTKPQGRGTGLGMSISHGIIKSHDGRLLLSSVLGSGTKVVIDLPIN